MQALIDDLVVVSYWAIPFVICATNFDSAKLTEGISHLCLCMLSCAERLEANFARREDPLLQSP